MQNMAGYRPIYVELWPKYILFIFDFVCFCTYSWPYPSYLASPVLVNQSKLIFSIIRNHTEQILYSYMSGKYHFQQLIFSLKNWTRKDGEQSIFNSQYLAILPRFNPYIHTICSLCIIEPTKVHLPTIYSISCLLYTSPSPRDS